MERLTAKRIRLRSARADQLKDGMPRGNKLVIYPVSEYFVW
jgi:hypothetical protein